MDQVPETWVSGFSFGSVVEKWVSRQVEQGQIFGIFNDFTKWSAPKARSTCLKVKPILRQISGTRYVIVHYIIYINCMKKIALALLSSSIVRVNQSTYITTEEYLFDLSDRFEIQA